MNDLKKMKIYGKSGFFSSKEEHKLKSAEFEDKRVSFAG